MENLRLEECNIDTGRNKWREVFGTEPTFTTDSGVNCVKIDVIGTNYPHEPQKDSYKMCLPVMVNMCKTLHEMKGSVVSESSVPNLQLHFECHFCQSDRCNSAPKKAATSLPFIFIISFVMLWFKTFQ